MSDDDDKLSFLNRDEKGRFAAKEAEPEPKSPEVPEAVETAPAAEPEPKPEPAKAETPAPAAPPASPPEPPAPKLPEPPKEPQHVPIAAILDEREKRQALQRQLDELNRKYEEATKKPVDLDPVSDPDGFRSHFEQELARTRWDTITTISKQWATKTHGAQEVEAAEAAVKAEVERNPGFFQELQRQTDPYDYAVRWHKRKQFTDGMADLNPEEWFRKKALEMGFIDPKAAAPAQPAPVVGTVSPQPAPLPKPSLATAPAAASHAPRVPIGPGSAFDAVIK